ncbi:MAG: hypothetical protein WKG07_28925 [Hymenobacter sp.]
MDSMARFLDDVGHPTRKTSISAPTWRRRGSRRRLIERLRREGGAYPHLRLRRQGARRPAAGPRVVDFPAVRGGHPGLGLDDATVSVELEYSPEPDKIVEWVRAYGSTAA